MNVAKKMLHELIEEIPDKDIAEVIDFVEFLKLKREKELFIEEKSALS